MWHFFHFIVRPAEALLGVFCLLTAIVLYPNEEGQIQSKFEDFWIKVDDYQQLALSRHAAFMQHVARLETQFLDRFFGHKLFSIKSIVMSVCCSFVSMITAIFYFGVTSRPDIARSDIAMFIVVGTISTSSACACLFLRKSSSIIAAGALPLGILFILLIGLGGSDRLQAGFVFAAGFVCDIIFVVVSRRLLQLAGIMTKTGNVVLVVFLNLLLATALVAPSLSIKNATLARFFQQGLSFAGLHLLNIISMTNIFDAALALLFVFLALLLVIHRAIWPLLNRTLFRMTDIGTKGRRAILVGAGLGLLGIAGLGTPQWLSEFLKHL
jgi:hypothetical protein